MAPPWRWYNPCMGTGDVPFENVQAAPQVPGRWRLGDSGLAIGAGGNRLRVFRFPADRVVCRAVAWR